MKPITDSKGLKKLQTIAQYNEDVKVGDAEIERGDFITAEDLKIEVNKW